MARPETRIRAYWLASVLTATLTWWPRPVGAAPPANEPAPATETEPSDPDPAPSSPIETSEPDDTEVEALQQRIDTLEQRLEAMQRRQDELEQQRTPRAAPPPPAQPVALPEVGDDEPPAPVATGDPNASADNRPPNYADGFHFGSYGRVVAGGDHRGRAGRDADIVARGSRLDESTYAELELRREDYWEQTGAYTRIVATVAFGHPLFHYNGRFDAQIAMRNLYMEEIGLGLKKLRVWAGSRMYRGDDIYLLDFWPLDNLNTVGGGAGYTFLKDLDVRVHAGINQPDHPFFFQTSPRPLPLGQLGATPVRITDRQKLITSAKVSNIFWLGRSGGGLKPVVYGEFHHTGAAQQEIADRQFESLPEDMGYLVGAQLGVFSGKRSSHLNLVFRYAGGLAAYGELNAPFQLNTRRTSRGAREILTAISGNYEIGPFGLLLGSYFRHFRDASADLDVFDLDEGIVIARPTLWLGKIAGISVEGSYQAQQRGVLIADDPDDTRPQFAQMGRFGIVPFLTPGGRGNYQRPHIRLIYLLSVRDDGARRLYPQDDVFSLRKIDHFIGLGVEWWFGSTSYFRD